MPWSWAFSPCEALCWPHLVANRCPVSADHQIDRHSAAASPQRPAAGPAGRQNFAAAGLGNRTADLSDPADRTGPQMLLVLLLTVAGRPAAVDPFGPNRPLAAVGPSCRFGQTVAVVAVACFSPVPAAFSARRASSAPDRGCTCIRIIRLAAMPDHMRQLLPRADRTWRARCRDCRRWRKS